MLSGGHALSLLSIAFFLSFLFWTDIANVIFHESCSIRQGQHHVEAADECLASPGLYNERRERDGGGGWGAAMVLK